MLPSWRARTDTRSSFPNDREKQRTRSSLISQLGSVPARSRQEPPSEVSERPSTIGSSLSKRSSVLLRDTPAMTSAGPSFDSFQVGP